MRDGSVVSIAWRGMHQERNSRGFTTRRGGGSLWRGLEIDFPPAFSCTKSIVLTSVGFQKPSNQFRNFLSGCPPQVLVEVRRNFCRRRIHFNRADSMLRSCLGKSGGRIHLAGCPDGDEKIRFREDEIDFVHEEGHFPKPDDVRAESSHDMACRAAIRLIQIVLARRNIPAIPAPRLERLPVHVDHVAAARPLVQIVNILGDHGDGAGKFPLQTRKGEMCRVGLSLTDFRAAHVVEFKNQRRIPMKSCGGRHILDPVALPKTAFPPKSLDSRLR